jgi:hypothetical protein
MEFCLLSGEESLFYSGAHGVADNLDEPAQYRGLHPTVKKIVEDIIRTCPSSVRKSLLYLSHGINVFSPAAHNVFSPAAHCVQFAVTKYS